MTNISNYFPHDSNARNDDRLIAVRMKLGAEGYGIYFMILERLREGKMYTCVRDYNIIAFDLRVAAEKVKAIVEDFGLFAFTEDRADFYSESLAKRMQVKDERAEKLKNAANKRWGKIAESQDLAEKEDARHMPSTSHAHAWHVQEKKEKKEKKEEKRKGEGERKETRGEFLLAKEKKQPATPEGFSGGKKPEAPEPEAPAMGVAELERKCAGNETWIEPVPPPPAKRPIDVLWAEFAADERWLETVAMKNGITAPRAQDWLKAFALHLMASGRMEETDREFKSYFANWTASEIRLGRTPVNAPKNTGKTEAGGKMDAARAMQMALIRKYGPNGANGANGMNQIARQIAIGG